MDLALGDMVLRMLSKSYVFTSYQQMIILPRSIAAVVTDVYTALPK